MKTIFNHFFGECENTYFRWDDDNVVLTTFPGTLSDADAEIAPTQSKLSALVYDEFKSLSEKHFFIFQLNH